MTQRREPPAPDVYVRVFENNPEGALILEDLYARFGVNPYVRGGLEAQRETDYRAGRKAVVDFILGRINQANGVNDATDEGDEARGA